VNRSAGLGDLVERLCFEVDESLQSDDTLEEDER
jgi:hypothetical protein